MVEPFVSSITREALYLTLLVSGLPVLSCLLVGFVVALFQATTQIQEQTLTFAPKILAVFGLLAIAGPWMGHHLLAFAVRLFEGFPKVVH